MTLEPPSNKRSSLANFWSKPSRRSFRAEISAVLVALRRELEHSVKGGAEQGFVLAPELTDRVVVGAGVGAE